MMTSCQIVTKVEPEKQWPQREAPRGGASPMVQRTWLLTKRDWFSPLLTWLHTKQTYVMDGWGHAGGFGRVIE